MRGSRSVWIPAFVIALMLPIPARALELHRPFGSVSLETSYDDHISGQSVAEVELYPAGNTDWRGTLSLGGGADLSLDERWSLYLGARLRGFSYRSYPDLSGMAGTATAEISAYDLPMGIDAFLGYGLSTDFSLGRSQTLALSLERPLAGSLALILAGGQYWHLTSSEGLSNRGPFADAGLRLGLPFHTSLSTTVSLLGRNYDHGRSDQVVSAGLGLSQRLWAGAYLRASYRRDLASSNESGRSFSGNVFTMGTSYYF